MVSFTRVELFERPGPHQHARSDPLEDTTADVTLEGAPFCTREPGRADEVDVVRSAHAHRLAEVSRPDSPAATICGQAS